MLNRLIYAGNDWALNEKSALFFYRSLYQHTDYFEPGVAIEDYAPAKILVSYVSSPVIDDYFLQFLLRMIDAGEYLRLCKEMFPEGSWEQLGEDLFDTTIPSYSSWKILVNYLAGGMEAESGYTLLHAAIANLDIMEVYRQIWYNKPTLQVRTNPRHEYFFDVYGCEPYTALELARFREGKFVKELQNKNKSNNSFLFESICLEQIRKIIQLLERD